MRVRPFTQVLAVGILFLGLHAFARGDEAPSVDPADLQKKIEKLQVGTLVLEAQVEYLLSREQDLTRYVAAGEERGKALSDMVRRMKQLGFQNAAIPASSRETLMAGLDALGRHLTQNVPKVTKAQGAKLRSAKRRR